MRVEMVNLPIFGEEVGVPFPCFDIKLVVDETVEDFTAIIKREAREILSKMSNKEYLAWRVITSMMPCLNHVLGAWDTPRGA